MYILADIMSFLDRFFGPEYEKELKAIKPIVTAINEQEPLFTNLTNEELVAKTAEFKDRLKNGASLDDLLVETFALVREGAKRSLDIRHYDVQMIGGIILHRGKITEMRTGEGKTLVGTSPVYLNALTGDGVHIVTVNDYLSRRDAVWMGQIYNLLGLSVGVINQDASYLYDPTHQEDKDALRDEVGSYKVVYEFLRPCTRQEAYQADITYGTNSEFGFDFLRDNIEYSAGNLRQRGLAYAVIDEIDSILIDEARTPLIISAPTSDSEDLYVTFANIARNLNVEEHFTIDEKMKAASLTNAGIEAAEKMLGIENIYTEKGVKYVHHLETAVKAKALYKKDKEYVVRNGEVVIVDEFTGRMQPGRRWSEGLHQAIEAKEGTAIQKESKTFASITYQNYFRMYDKLAGMTGTAMTSQEEFLTVYDLEVIPVPTNKPIARKDRPDLVYQTEKAKFEAIIEKVKEVHQTGQPILIGTASIETNERLATALSSANIQHQVLNAKNHEQEGEIIASAGKVGGVTLATNMAGRGVDIKLGGPDATKEEYEAVLALGGLFVLGTERHEARRIDNQLRGRSGRQGDVGETQFYISTDDNLMRVFGGERMKSLMSRLGLPEDQPINNSMITKMIEGAQTRIEGFHFDSRKQVLAYDDVLNQQRIEVYGRRHKLLVGDEEELNDLLTELRAFEGMDEVIATKETEFGETVFRDIMRRLALQMIDTLWVEHLEVMSYARSSVNLRAYGQRDPLVEYRKEGVRLFKEMQQFVLIRINETLPKLQPVVVEKKEAVMKKQSEEAQASAGGKVGKKSKQPVRNEPSINRNDLVIITKDGVTETVKYKKALPLLETGGWTILETKRGG